MEIDDASARFYRTLPGTLGDRLREVMRTADGKTSMSIIDGRCPMWRSDGLCRIQAELGESALCETCRMFPRLTHDYGDFAELGLELSCPEAAKLILNAPLAPLMVDTRPDGGTFCRTNPIASGNLWRWGCSTAVRRSQSWTAGRKAPSTPGRRWKPPRLWQSREIQQMFWISFWALSC